MEQWWVFLEILFVQLWEPMVAGSIRGASEASFWYAKREKIEQDFVNQLKIFNNW